MITLLHACRTHAQTADTGQLFYAISLSDRIRAHVLKVIHSGRNCHVISDSSCLALSL